MKKVIIFEVDDDKELNCTICPMKGYCFANGDTPPEKIPDNCPAVNLPSRTPMNVYNFETYVNGYAKGNNDVLDKLEGKNGEYDPSVDKIEQ